VELNLRKLHIVSTAETLPIQVEDVSRPQPLLDAQQAELDRLSAAIHAAQARLEVTKLPEDKKSIEEELAKLHEHKGTAVKFANPDIDTRLNHRIIDLRTQANHAIFRIQAGVCQLFREYLSGHDFVEIHTPKMISAASEGGATVFKIKYFDTEAYLAQSPQFYKQMMICSDYERVFEIGPVFRAENANTPRHLTEFTGLDMEMSFNEHYHEVLDMMDGMFVFIFDGIASRFARELDIINAQYPFTPIVYKKPTLRLRFAEGIALLHAAGVNAPALEDLSTAHEKHLGQLVKETHGVDFYVLDKYPKSARPFYTMPESEESPYTNSYDLFVRGQEIVSGSQRIHDAAMLEKSARDKGITLQLIRPYLDAFKYGAPPHGGCGIGLERMVMLYLNLGNIRRGSLFPRDPGRLNP